MNDLQSTFLILSASFSSTELLFLFWDNLKNRCFICSLRLCVCVVVSIHEKGNWQCFSCLLSRHYPPRFDHVLLNVSRAGYNRPLALRGHVTNASFKQWVGILLMPKIDRAHKNYLTPEIWEETHLREIFYGTLIFQQSSMICIGHHVGGHTVAFQHGGQNFFLLISS